MRVRALWLLLLSAPLVAAEAPLRLDFETGTQPSAWPQLSEQRPTKLSVATPGAADSRQCLLVESAARAKYAGVTFKGPFKLTHNLVLSFDYRAEAVEGDTNYVGVIFALADGRHYFASVPFQSQWRHVVLPVALIHAVNAPPMQLGQEFASFQIYGRAKDDAGARMKVWIDNVELSQRSLSGAVSDRRRTSHANPPLFIWPRQQVASELAFSPDASFADGRTTIVRVEGNWYLPPAPLEPGTWYWRVRTRNELYSGWSDAERVTIEPEAHRFQAPAIDWTAFARRAHPRLVDAPAERAKLSVAERARLVSEAANIHRQGIDDDCPVWVAGDARWPTWIEWYGKAHGGITSRAGGRLERLGRLCAVTGDEQVRGWTRELALKASRWDPAGGSSMRNGDIGAHHFLRGLNSCYDALAEVDTPTALAPVRQAIEARAKQFWDHHNPYRANEYNNHSWLNVLALAESGLVLCGELPAASDWARYSLDLFVGRFLCALGYDGDNNEGISYWGYGLLFMNGYAELMKRVTGIDLYQHPWMRQTCRFPLYTTPPQGYTVSFADTGQPNHGIVGPYAQKQVLELARQTGDPCGLWYGGAREVSGATMPKPPVDIPPSVHYRFIGWAVFNTSLVDGRDGVTVAMRSGPFYAGHQHEDLNGFVIHAYGEKLAIDGGHYDWYGSPQFTKWSTLTRAHCSVLVNGQDQGSRRDGADGRIARWFESPGFGYTEGEVTSPLVYRGQVKQFTRRLLFIKPGFVVICDRLAAASGPAQFDWLLQSVGEPKIDAARRSFRLTSGRASLSGRFLAPADATLKVTSGFPADAQPVDRYSTRPSPPEVTPLEYHLAATPAARRADEQFLAVMRIQRGTAPADGVEPVAATNALGGRFSADGLTYTVLCRQAGATGPLATTELADGLSTDGEVAVVARTTDGRLARVLLIDGTVVRARQGGTDGAELVRLPVRGDTAVLETAEGRITTQGDGRLVRPDSGPVAALSHALPAQPLLGTEPVATVQGYAQRRADGFAYHYWSLFRTATTVRGTIRVAGGPGEHLLTLDGRAYPPDQPVVLAAGPHTLLLTGRQLDRIELQPLPGTTVDAAMLPKGAKPAATAVLVEAEKLAAEGPVKGKAMEKVGASGGVAHCVWDTPGQWAEWELTVPTAGRWSLLVRGAGDDGPVLRGLYLDGTPAAGAELVRLPPTGGWCRTTDDWRWFRVPLPQALSAGRHRIRLEQLGGSMNLDQIGLEPTAP